MKKLFFLLTGIVLSLFSSLHASAQNRSDLFEWPAITENTKDIAYDAPASKLYGTWVFPNNGQKWIFNSNGTFEIQEPDDLNYGIKTLRVFKGTWKKRGDILKFDYHKNGNYIKAYYIISPEAKKDYANLSLRRKDDIQSSLKKRTEDSGYVRLDEYDINYVSNDYIILRQIVFGSIRTWELIKNSKYQQVIKEVEAKEAKEKAEKAAAQQKAEEERQQKLAEENKKKEIAQYNSILGFLPLNLQEKIEKGDITLADAAKEIHSLTIPATKTSFPQYAYNYFTELDTLIAHSTVNSVSKGKNPLSLLVLNSINTTFPEGIAKNIVIEGIDFPNAEDLSYYKVVVPFQYKDWKSGDPYLKKVKEMTTPFILKITQTARPNGLDGLNNLKGVFITSVNGGEIYPVAFGACTQLQVVDITEGIINIGGNAFNGCTSLKKVVLPNSIKSIEAGAFYKCYKLSEINLPKNLETIGDKAFWGANINTVTVPASVKKIGKEAFNSSSNVYFEGLEPPKIDKTSFPAGCVAHVPNAALKAYQKSYKKYFSEIVGMD